MADLVHGVVEFLMATPHDKDICAFCDEELCRSKPNPGTAARYDCYFSLQLAHDHHSRFSWGLSGGVDLPLPDEDVSLFGWLVGARPSPVKPGELAKSPSVSHA
jgi:hypothetical protein